MKTNFMYAKKREFFGETAQNVNLINFNDFSAIFWWTKLDSRLDINVVDFMFTHVHPSSGKEAF